MVYSKRPTQIIPYPYLIKLQREADANKAESSHVLFVGDRMGAALSRFIPELTKKISKDLQEPLTLFNWSKDQEGIHRTIAKLKTLKSLPPVVVYHGASQEFFEKKFNLVKKRKILKNFELYNDPKLSTAVMTFPFLSRFIYKPVDIQVLPEEPNEDLTKYSPFFKQVRMELTYKLFEYEIEELINYVRSKDSNLLIITTPVNLEVGPKEVCKNAITPSILKMQKIIEDGLKNEQYKSHYNQARELALKSIGNAKSHYLHGMIALNLLKYKESKQSLEKAEAFDCSRWRGSIIFNNIMKKKAERNNIHLIDFNEMTNINIGRDSIFHDELYPQHIYYQQLMDLIEKKIRKAYKL